MASLEDELRDLKQKNNDLVQKVQYWKMLAGQRENEKLDLMKEINELRLKLSRLRSNGNSQATNLESALQSAVQKALALLVRSSGEIATIMDIAKGYMRDREELDNDTPRWSSIGGTPSTAKKEKIHRVPPLMIGGQSIQPVVALTMLDTSNPRSLQRSSNQNRNVTERAVPMHMLQDVYIPLTRIDMDLHTQAMETEEANNADDSTELLQLEDNEGTEIEESQRMDEDEEFDSTRILDAVSEDTEPENEEESPPRTRIENPLEGPSWMLDAINSNQASTSKSRHTLEPDSTTEPEDYRRSPPSTKRNKTEATTQLPPAARVSREFSPTVRRRARGASPPPATPRRASHYSPRPHPRRMSNSGRVLKVLVAKMRLDGEGVEGAGAGAGEGSPPKRAATAAAVAALHAPSPNGATVAGVIVSESSQNELESVGGAGEPLRPRSRPPPDAAWADDAPYINTERRERTRTVSRERTREQDDDTLEQINVNRRTDRERNRSREHSADARARSRERTNSREDDRDIETQRTNRDERSKERDGRRNRKQTNREGNEPTHSRERKHTKEKRTDRENTEMEIEESDSRERSRHTNVEIQNRSRDLERPNRRTDSVERINHRYRSMAREESSERQDNVRADSRGSDSSHLDDTSRRRAAGRAGSCDSDSGSGGERERGRRVRKVVTYKEKPLNSKLRR